MANSLNLRITIKYILYKKYVLYLFVIIFFATKSLAEGYISLPKLSANNLEIPFKQEKQLGEIWLQHLRSYITLDTDPIIYDYVESILFNLSSYSNLDSKSLKLIIVKNPSLNAFAVPGGIIGINTGLLNFAKTEAQLASVLCHELAHLSQRHFFRRQEASKDSNLTLLAGMLSGLLLGIAAEGDAAQAAIFSAQAAVIGNQLRYSRLHEKEADRIGMKILIDAGYSPRATVDIFKEMLDAKRLYGNDTPEFLLTHPVTERRISDAKNRIGTKSINNKNYNTLDYSLIRARNEVNTEPYRKMITDYENRLNAISKNNFNVSKEVTIKKKTFLYGLALSYLKNNQWKEAREISSKLLKKNPNKIIYKLLDIETDIVANEHIKAEKKLLTLNSLVPNNYPISMLLGKTLHNNKKFTEASNIFLTLAKNRPNQINIWYHAAESQGLAGDIVGLHRSRAEFFFLKGNFKQSLLHLQQALFQSLDDFQMSSKIKKRMSEINKLKLFSKKHN